VVRDYSLDPKFSTIEGKVVVSVPPHQAHHCHQVQDSPPQWDVRRDREADVWTSVLRDHALAVQLYAKHWTPRRMKFPWQVPTPPPPWDVSERAAWAIYPARAWAKDPPLQHRPSPLVVANVLEVSEDNDRAPLLVVTI